LLLPNVKRTGDGRRETGDGPSPVARRPSPAARRPAPAARVSSSTMRLRKHIGLALLALLLFAAVYGVFLTRPGSPATKGAPATQGQGPLAFNDASLEAVKALLRMPMSPEERETAETTLRLADKASDLAFAQAVWRMASRPAATTPEAHQINVYVGRELLARLPFPSESVDVVLRSIQKDVTFQPTDMIVAKWPVRIGQVFVKEGDPVPPGTAVLSLTDPNFTVRVRTHTTGRELAQLQRVCDSVARLRTCNTAAQRMSSADLDRRGLHPALFRCWSMAGGQQP